MNIYDQMDGVLGMAMHCESFYRSSYYGPAGAWLANAYVSPERKKLNDAKEYLKTHPYNPGVLNRWLEGQKAETAEFKPEAK